MEHGPITLGKEQSAKLLGWGIRFFLAAALTASQTPGGYAPFAHCKPKTSQEEFHLHHLESFVVYRQSPIYIELRFLRLMIF